MENQWKFYEKSSKIELGGVLGPLGASWGALLAPVSVLGASWERHPGALRGPHMDPRKRSKSFKKRYKIAWIFWSIFGCDIDPKMGTEWLPKPSKHGQKSLSFFDRFFHRFLDRSWGPKSLKMSTSCTQEAHFQKIAFSDSDIFWKQGWWKKAPEIEPTWLKKSMKKSEIFLIDFGPIF